MVYTLEEISRRVRPVAEKYKLKAVYVFGSYARGEAREDSDVDLLVDDTDSGLRGWDYGGLYSDLEDALEKELDMVTVGALEQPVRYKSDIHFREAVEKERLEIYAAA
ncbi:nucleotidyltransferase domain-containing protein [Oscillospiraceae bacterium 38-13]